MLARSRGAARAPLPPMQRSEGLSGSASAARRSGAPAGAGWAAWVVLAVTAAVFARALGNEFVDWDDEINFVHNPGYRGFGWDQLRWMFGSFYVGHYMPLTWLTCALDWELWGLDPAGYHLTNLLLHALGAALLCGALARLLAIARPVAAATRPALLTACAAAGALTWSVHPLRVESVAWATERRDVLSGALLLGSFVLYLRARTPREAVVAPPPGARDLPPLGALLLFAASLLSKTAGMAYPLVLLAVDAWPLRRFEREGVGPVLREKLPFLALALGGAVLGWLGQVHSTGALVELADYGPLRRLAQASYGLAFYVARTALPVGLSPFHLLRRDFDPAGAVWIASAAAVAIAVGLAYAARRRAPALPVALVSYAVLIAPFLGLTQAGMHLVAERYSYLAALPFAGLVAGGLAIAAERRSPRATLALAAAVIAVLAGLTWRQIGFWRDSVTLWERVVAVDPEHHLGWHRLGVARHRREQHDGALAAYDRALELQPDRDGANARYDRSLTLLALGRRDQALDELQRVLRASPAHPGALRVAEDVLVGLGRRAEAMELLERGLRADPTSEVAATRLARFLRQDGEVERAEGLLETSLALAPGSSALWNQLGLALLDGQRFPQAEHAFRRALELGPPSAGAWTNLGVALEMQGRRREAEAAWRRALELDPAQGQARRYLDG